MLSDKSKNKMRRARQFLIFAVTFAVLPAAALAQNWNQAPNNPAPGNNLPGPIWNANAPGFVGPQSAAISITGNGGFGGSLSIGGASGFGGFSPAAALSISAPQAYFGNGVKGTIIGAYAGFTTAGDILTDGLVKAGSFQGDGSLLTLLNAGNLASGIVPLARLSGTYNIDISGHATYLGSSTAVTADGTGNLSAAVVTTPSICLSGDCKNAWPAGGGGGGGTVTSVGAGQGLTAPVDPIVGAGTLNVGTGTGITVGADSVSLDTAFTDNRYVNVSGDSMTGDLNGPRFIASTQLNSGGTLVVSGNSTLSASTGFGGYAPDATWRVSSPNAYYGNGVIGTIIGAGGGQGAGDLKSDGTIQGSTVKGTSQLCIGADCRNVWPAGGGGGGTVTSVGAGQGLTATTDPIVGAGSLSVGAGTGITVGADSVALDTAYADARYLNTTGDTVTGNLQGAQSISAGNFAPDATWRVSSPSAYFGSGAVGTIIGAGGGQGAGDLKSDGTIQGTTLKGTNICFGSDCRSAWPVGGGGGSVTSVSAGTGIVATPNPITGAGSVALDTAYADARYLNTTGDTVTGNLQGAQSISAGNYAPDATWRVSSPSAYFGDGVNGTIIGAGNVQSAGSLRSDGTIQGGIVKGLNQLCIGADCRNVWPDSFVNNDTLQMVTARGATTNILSSFQGGISAAGGTAGAFTGNVTVNSGNLTASGGVIASGDGFNGICATSGAGCSGGNMAIGGTVKAEAFCLPGSPPGGGCVNTWSTLGTITQVTAGNGLTGGGTSGPVTLDVQAGNGIIVSGDTVQLDPNYAAGPYVRKVGDTMTGSLTISGGVSNLSVGGSATVSGGLNLGSASGAAVGSLRQSGATVTVNSQGSYTSPGYFFGPSGSPEIYYDNQSSLYLTTTAGLTVPALTISPGNPVAVPSGLGLWTKQKAYFQITAPYGTGNRVEIGNGSGGGNYGFYVKNGPSAAKFENGNTLTGVSLADATLAINAYNASGPVYVGHFENSAGGPTKVDLANTDFGVVSQGAGTYGGTFTTRSSTAGAYLAGSLYGVAAYGPAGGYSIYASGPSYFTGGALNAAGGLLVSGADAQINTRLGIGTAPSTKLQVWGSGGLTIDSKFTGRMQIGADGNGNFGGIWFGTDTTNATGLFLGQKDATRLGVWNGNQWAFWINNVGNGYLRGQIFVNQPQNAGDVAEPAEIVSAIEKGDVVVVDSFDYKTDRPQFRRAETAYDRRVAGVISTNPSVILAGNENDDHLAVSGIVPVKVDASYAAVKLGDLLTSSVTPGYAMKASDPEKSRGAVIGKALEPLKSGQGKILMLVTLQ